MTQDRRITDKLPGQPLQWDETASPSAAPAAGQAVIDMLKRAMTKVDTLSDWQRADLIGFFCNEWNVTAPVAADTEQATDEQQKECAPPFAAPASQHGAWVATEDRMPEIPANDSREFIIACQRGHNGKTYVFAADYLNAKLLLTDDDDCPEDGTPFTGWYRERDDSSGEYDTAWNPVCQAGDVVTHWMPLPLAPEQSAPLATPADAGAGWTPTTGNAQIDSFLSEYEIRADSGVYTLTAHDRWVIANFLIELDEEMPYLARLSTSGAPVTAEPVQSIDTPEFRRLLSVCRFEDSANVDAANSLLVSYIDSTKLATPAPADRDAIRNEALEEAARECGKVGASDIGEEGTRAALDCLQAVRALKSMERAADAVETRDAEGGEQ